MDLDVLLAHEDSRRALASLATLSLPLGKRTLQYIRLFKPATRQLGHGRVVKLIEELLPDLQRRAITHNGRDWDASLETWNIAIERVLERRDNGKLTLPLKSHGYLYEVIVGLVDKAESAVEKASEADRRARTPGADAQPVAETRAVTAHVLITAPAGPSPYARKLLAQNEARKTKPLDSCDEIKTGDEA